MDAFQAQRVIESLRMGIPPDGFVRHFTVGRSSEITLLHEWLERPDTPAVWLQANYGSGKTHLLRFIREHALAEGYAVSSVTLDASSAVRFNRMDQILGAVCRAIEVPNTDTCKGIRSFFNFLFQTARLSKSGTFWTALSRNWKWDYSDVLESPALFVAFRAWLCDDPAVRDTVEDWMLQPWNYRTQRKRLYQELVGNLGSRFRDPRREWQFYADETFLFHTQAYAQCWGALRDLNRLACEAGLKGLVILFDEFEDVLTNLRNSQHQDQAFWNLFRFFRGKDFTGKAFYAVTPEFSDKAKKRLDQRANWAYGAFAAAQDLEQMPRFQMSPLEMKHLRDLAMRILVTHGTAYGWQPDYVMKNKELDGIINRASSIQIQDRTRQTIVTVVKALDSLLQGDTEAVDEIIENVPAFDSPSSQRGTKSTQMREPAKAQSIQTETGNSTRSYMGAKGYYTPDGFMVLKGSRASATVCKSFQSKTGDMKLRQQLLREGVLLESDNGEYMFAQDYLFRSSSSAASIVGGNSKSGPQAWGPR